MHIKAYAKINWTLDITGQREDGYHLMDMLMQQVSLYDNVWLEKNDALTLETSGEPLIPADEGNLAWRAAAALREACGVTQGAHIHVEKHIPAGAGMGGGSADAAAVLVGLNELWGLHLPKAELERIGLTLGADVPYCIRGGLTRTQGIGESMQALPCARQYHLCVIQPCEGLSTGAVFRVYHACGHIVRPKTDDAQRALAEGNTALLAASLGNVMQQASAQMRPEIDEAIIALRAQGAACALMTGSGSAVFGVFESWEDARQASAALGKKWARCWACSTLTDEHPNGTFCHDGKHV